MFVFEIEMILANRAAEDSACTRKYVVVGSCDFWLVFFMISRNVYKFISINNQD